MHYIGRITLQAFCMLKKQQITFLCCICMLQFSHLYQVTLWWRTDCLGARNESLPGIGTQKSRCAKDLVVGVPQELDGNVVINLEGGCSILESSFALDGNHHGSWYSVKRLALNECNGTSWWKASKHTYVSISTQICSVWRSVSFQQWQQRHIWYAETS